MSWNNAFILLLAFATGFLVAKLEEPEPVFQTVAESSYAIMYPEEMYERDDIVEEAAWRASQFEGFSPTPYELWGTWHIGYGTTISGPNEISYISEQDAYDRMLSAMYYFYDTLSAQWPEFDSSVREYKVVLMDMAYNMGIPRLMQFTELQECALVTCAQLEIRDSLYYQQVTGRAEANINYLW